MRGSGRTAHGRDGLFALIAHEDARAVVFKGKTAADQIVERTRGERDADLLKIIGNEYKKERYCHTEDEERRVKELARIPVRSDLKPSADAQRRLSYRVVVLDEVDHAECRENEDRTAYYGYNEQSESLIADTCDDCTYRYTHEV